MQITIRGQGSYTLDLNDDETLTHLKSIVCKYENTDNILLYVSGKPLSEEGLVRSIGNCAVDVTVPLLGGKTHGTLGRAGKVRAQTPYVEPEEKKKKRTGRAGKRIKYNRRFVNVVTVSGRKRGPNANS